MRKALLSLPIPRQFPEVDAGRTHLSDTSVAKAASLARMLQERAEPRRLLRTAFIAKILQMLRTLQAKREKVNPSPYESFLKAAGKGAAVSPPQPSRLPHRPQIQLGRQNGGSKLPPASMTHPDRMAL